MSRPGPLSRHPSVWHVCHTVQAMFAMRVHHGEMCSTNLLAHSQAMGAVTVRHFARLMPHLLRWLHSPDPVTAAAAVAALRVIVLRCWPRMPAHALLIGQHLQASC